MYLKCCSLFEESISEFVTFVIGKEQTFWNVWLLLSIYTLPQVSEFSNNITAHQESRSLCTVKAQYPFWPEDVILYFSNNLNKWGDWIYRGSSSPFSIIIFSAVLDAIWITWYTEVVEDNRYFSDQSLKCEFPMTQGSVSF